MGLYVHGEGKILKDFKLENTEQGLTFVKIFINYQNTATKTNYEIIQGIIYGEQAETFVKCAKTGGFIIIDHATLTSRIEEFYGYPQKIDFLRIEKFKLPDSLKINVVVDALDRDEETEVLE